MDQDQVTYWRERAEKAEAQVVALDVSLRNLAKGVTNRPWKGGPPALHHLPDLEGLRLVEKRIEHLGHLQFAYLRDVGGLRDAFHRAMRLLRRHFRLGEV